MDSATVLVLIIAVMVAVVVSILIAIVVSVMPVVIVAVVVAALAAAEVAGRAAPGGRGDRRRGVTYQELLTLSGFPLSNWSISETPK
jgi:hypothetical protein